MAHRGHIGKAFVRAGVLALFFGLARIGMAQTITKNNTNSGGGLASGSDWNGGTAPGATSIAEWTNNTGGGSYNLGGNLTWGEVKIVNPNSSVTFNSGNTLTLNGVAGVGIDMSTASQSLTINPGVALGAAQTWITGSGGALTIGGNVNEAGFGLTIGGTGNATISGAVSSSGSGSLTMNSTGTLTLSGNNTYSGGTTISNGILVANTLFNTGSTSSSIGTGNLTLNGGTLRYDGAALGTASFSTTVGARGGTLDANSSIFYNGTLSGSGTLNILDSSDSGNQWLFTAGSSGFTGNINIGNGTAGSGWLQVRGVTSANQVGTGTVTVNGGGTFSYDTGSPATIANPIVLNGGALGAQSVAVTYSGPIAISNNSFVGGVQTTVGTTMTLSGVITGPGGFTTAGNNGTTTVVLGNANTFSGGVTINSGTLELNNTLAVQNSTVNDATNNALAFGTPTSYTLGGLSGTGNIGLTNSAGGIALSVGNNNANTTYSGVLSGSGSLTKIGTGVLTVSGANSYSGATTISAGTLKLGANNVIPDSASAGNLTDNGTLDMGTFNETINGLTGTGIVDNSGGGTPTLTVGNNNASSTFSGVIQNTSGTLALTKTGTGVLTLAGTSANTFSGLTTVNAGELDLDKTAAVNAIGGNLTIAGGLVKLLASQQIGNNAAVTINSGTFNLNGNSETFDAFGGTGGTVTNSAAGASTMTIGSNNSGGTYSGTIDDGAGTIALVKNGTGTETLSGNSTYSGGTTINDGTIVASSSTALGSGELTMTGGTLQLSASLSLGGLSGTAGTVGIFANNTTETLTVGSDNTSSTFSGTISQGGNANTHLALAKTGSGVLTLTGNNSFNGATTIGSGGAINIQNANALGTSAVTVNNGGALQIQGGITAAQALTLNGTGVANDGALRNISGNNTYSGGITLGSASRINSDSGTLTISSSITGGNFGLTIGGAGNTLFSAAIPSTITSLTKDGSGILILANAGDAYTGDTTISAGTLKLGASNVLPGGASAGNVTDNGTLDMAGFSDTINGLNGSGTVDNSTGTGNTLTVGNNNASSTFSGVIQDTSGTLALTKIGTGTLTLSGNNTFGGVLTIQAGTLAVSTINNASAAGPLGESTNAVVLGGASTTGTFEYTGGTASSTKSFTVGSVGGAIQVDASGTALTLSGQVQQNSANNGQQLLTKTGPGTLVLAGAGDNANLGLVVSNGTVVLAKTSSSTVHAVGFGGVTVDSGGLVQLAGTGGDQIYNGASVMVNGGIFDLNGESETVASVIIDNGGLLTNGIAGAALTGGITNGGTIFVSQNTFFNSVVTNTGAFFFQGAISNNLVNSGNGTLTLNNRATITQTAAINGGTLNLNGQTMTNGLLLVSGTGVLTNGTVGATVNGGVSNAATISVTANTFFNGPVTNTGAMFFQGAISNNFVNSGSGTVTLNNAATITQTAGIEGGTLNLNGQTMSNGLLIVDGAGGVVTNGIAGATVNGGVSNASVIAVTANTFFNGPVTNTGAIFFQGAISNGLANSGSFNLNNNATLTVAPANKGTINVAASTLTVNPDWANAGTVQLGGGVLTGGNLTNSSGANLAGFGAVSNQLVNAGIVTATNGNLNLVGAANGSGVYRAVAGTLASTLTFVNGGSIGSLFNTGATVQVEGALTNTSLFVNEGTLMVAGGVYQSAANLTNAVGATIANSGAGSINAAAVVNLGTILATNATFTISNFVAQGGTVTIGAGGTLTLPGASSLTNFGTINLQGTAGNNAVLNLAGAVLTNESGGTITGGGIIQNAAQVVNLAGGSILATSKVVELQFTNANTFGNAGTIGATAGATLTFGTAGVGSAIITNYGTINLANGTLRSGTITNLANGFFGGTGVVTAVVVNQGRMNFSGTISNGLQNSGSFTLADDTTVTSNIVVTSGGVLDLVGNNLTNNSLLAISSGGVLTNGGAANAGAMVNGGVSNAGTVYVNANTYFNGTVTNTGAFFFQGAISNNLVNSGNGTVTLNNTATITQTANINGGTLNLNGQTMANGLLLVSGTGVMTNGVAGATVNGGVSNANVIAVTANTYFNGPVTNTGTFQWQGAISNTFVNSGTTKLNGAGTITGTSSISAGSFDLNGKNFFDSLMVVNGTGALTNSTAGASVSGAINLQGATLSGQLVTNAATLSGSGTISAPLVNSAAGVLTANSGLLTVSGALTQNGTINVAAASTLNVQQAFSNNGSLNMQGGFLTGGNINNTAGNNISGFGTISNAVTSAGLVTASGGTLTMAGGMTAQAGGGINVVSGGDLNVTPDWVNSGTTTVNSGGTISGGTMTNTTGTLSGSGAIDSFVVNQGRVNWGGTLNNNYLQTAGSLTFSGNATITGNATISGGGVDLLAKQLTAGVLTINNGGTMQNSTGTGTITGNVVNNGSVNFNVNDTFDDSHVVINGQVVNNGTWTEAGVINGTLVNTGSFDWTSHSYFFGFTQETSPILNGGITNTGSLTFDPSYVAQVNGSVTNSGAINFNGTATGNLWQSGGTFTLNGAGTISGPANVAGGSFNLNGENYNGSTMVVSGTGALTNAIANANFNSGLSNAANVGVTANTFFKGAVTNTGTFAFMGAVSNTLVNSGDVVLNGSATISGVLANSGSVNVNGGVLSLVVAPTQTGTIAVNNGATLNAAQAWVNNGTISMGGGVVTNAVMTNAGFVSGYGTIDGGGVANNGKVFANAGSISGNGTLTVRLTSFTNNSAATIGTASSNAVLNILQAGNTLINLGTVSLSGGTIDFNGGAAGTITNYNVIAGVGDVANFPIINAGTLSSFVAQAPIPGLSNLIATIGVTNNGLLGANNQINGAATLSLTVNGGGSAIVNQGTVALQGGFLTVNGGAGVITNNALIYGIGTQNLSVANLASGKIMASNGIFSLGLQGNANAGVLSNLNAASTILLTNKFLVNTGTIVLDGGGLLLSGSVITNESSITGPGAISSSLYNDTPGVVLATNGLLNVATNAGEVVQNLGLFTITDDGTLDIVPSWVNTNGTVNILGGGLMGGAVTNVGLVSGFGTISSQLVNMGGGTLTASGAGSLTLVAAPTQDGWVNIANAGTLNVEQAWLNSGTVNVQGGSLVGSTVTNTGTIFGSGTITPQVRNNSGGTVTANGGTLTLTVAPSQLGSVIISNAATLNVLQAWQNGGTLNLQGGTAIGSSIANASAITGFGTITPQVQNAVGGTVTPSGGTLTLTAAPSQLGTFAVASGSTLNVQQAWQNGGLLSMSGGAVIGSTITNAANVSGFGTITPQLVNNAGATVTVNGGTLTLTAGPVQLGNLVISNAATLNALQAWQNGGSMKIRGGTVIGSSITNSGSLEGYGTIDPQVVNNAGATLTADSGLLTLALALMQNGTAIVTNGGTLNVLAAWQNSGTIAMLGGNITGSTVTNTGTMTGFGGVSSIVNNDLIFVTNGTLQATASFTQNGTVSIAANAQLDVTPTWLNNGTILVNGGFTSGGTMTNGTSSLLAGFGTISNAVVNAGSIVATNGALNLVNGLTQSGTITVANAATFNSVPAWQNGGFLSLLGGSVIGGQVTNSGNVTGFGTFSPSVINNSGATITASSGGTLTLTAIPLQNGVVNILGTLDVASAWSNGSAGTVAINGGVLTGGTFTVDGTVGGNGTIAANMIVGGKTVTVSGGTLNVTALTTLNGGAINNGALVNYGTISGDGTIGSTLSNPGYVRATNGLLYVQALSGNQSTGTLEASAGGTLQANGVTSWLNNGQVILSGGTVIGGAISNNTSRLISGYGTIAPNVYNNGQILANTAGQTLTLNGTLVNQSSGAVTVNTGNLVVDGAFVNQGTLAMANSMGTFGGTVVNSGAWITDPTTNVFQNTFTVTNSGFIQSGAGDVYIFSNNATTAASFINLSTNKTQYNTLNGNFQFANTLGATQVFATAGLDLEPAQPTATNAISVLNRDLLATPGFSNNFALGTLQISSFTTVRVDNAFLTEEGDTNADLTAGLYLNNLDMGLDSLLIVSTNVEVYFINSNNWSLANVQLQGNPNYDQTFDGIHQLVVVPEPTIVLLWLSSIATIYAARKRGAGKK